MGSSIGGLLGKTIYLAFIMGLVLFLAYIVTRFIGSKYMKTLKGKNITVIESISLGLDKVLFLVKVGSQYMLISSSGKNINLISEIKPGNIISNQTIENNEAILNSSAFTKYFDLFKNKLVNSDPSVEEFNNQQNDNIEHVEKNVEKVKDLFNSIKVPNKGGIE